MIYPYVLYSTQVLKIKRKITSVIFLFITLFLLTACVEREQGLQLNQFETLIGNEIILEFDQLNSYGENEFFFIDENKVEHSLGYNDSPVFFNGVIQVTPTASVVQKTANGGVITESVSHIQIALTLWEGLKTVNEDLETERYSIRNMSDLTASGKLYLSRNDNELIRISIPREYPLIVNIIR